MKKLVLVGSLFMNLSSFAQTLPNAGFEDWSNMGAYEDPNNWITFNMFSEFSPTYPIGVAKTTDAYSGTYACALETKLDESDTSIVPAFLLSGTGNFFSGLSFIANTVRPNTMSFYYKYTPVNGDTSTVTVSFTKWDFNTNTQITVGFGGLALNTVTSGFTLAQIPIEYFTTDVPDTMLVFAITSEGELPQVGTQLILDDFSFSMFGVGVSEVNLITSSVYPNPAKNEVQFSVANGKPTEAVLTDLNGKEVGRYELNTTSKTVDVSDLKQGIYLYQLNENGKTISKGKINVVK